MNFSLYLRKFAAFYAGCLACCLLQGQAHLTAVVSSAIVGLAATFVPTPDRWDRKGMQAAAYAGSFAGMCSRDILSGHTEMLFISMIGALIYVLAKPHFNGFGGKLGAIALISSLIVLLVQVIR